MGKFEVGDKLKKHQDDSIVTVKRVKDDYIVLDGDFEPNHVVMKEKVHRYYSRTRPTNDERRITCRKQVTTADSKRNATENNSKC